eukprot:6179627-Pleurochrysis_carterae.AAC.1
MAPTAVPASAEWRSPSTVWRRQDPYQRRPQTPKLPTPPYRGALKPRRATVNTSNLASEPIPSETDSQLHFWSLDVPRPSLSGDAPPVGPSQRHMHLPTRARASKRWPTTTSAGARPSAPRWPTTLQTAAGRASTAPTYLTAERWFV